MNIIKIRFVIFLLLLFSGCKKEKSQFYDLPDFVSNADISDVWMAVKEIVAGKAFAVAYTTGIGFVSPHNPNVKIVCRQDSIWQRIEISATTWEVSTIIHNARVSVPKR